MARFKRMDVLSAMYGTGLVPIFYHRDVEVGMKVAAACVEGLCGPCESDSDCALREVCVLDHCVKRDNVRCRSRRDCASRDEYCLLTGFSSDPRGNGEMRAICQSEHGGTWLGERKPPAPKPVDSSAKAQLQESVADGLLRDLDEVKP